MREPKREKEEEDLKRVSHYRVIRTLGQGGMGKVYEAFDETLERKVALKAIRADHRLRQHAKIRFLREARTLSQLDHPNICRIHDYVVGDGKDYLVLELVEGRTLRHALEDGLNKTEKLAIAEQIAEALDVAHAAGIVHRDLKPDNVMLTADRVVKILDFGLARMEPGETSRSTNEEEAPTSEEGALSGGALSESEEETYPAGTLSAMSLDITAEPAGPVVQTRRGALVGTVMWMSPEQAAGNPATTASDMYAYGLLLQWMLTGRSPYSRTESADALLAKVFQGDTLPVDGVSPDLAMLIRRLESMAPAHRPTAFEALERLRFLRDKPKRRLRMAIVILAVAVVTLGALKYTLDLGRERSLAIEAREEAERRREQAERLIDFMLGDLRTKLTPIGNLDILDDIGDEALEYFGGIPADELDDAELFRRSGALRLLGEVRVARGDLPAALTAFEESLALANGLFARDPQNVDWVQGLGTAHYWIGYVLDDQGDSDGALEHFEAYQRAAEQLARIDPDRPEWQLEVGYSHFNIGVVLDARGELEQALVEYQKTLAIEEDVSRRLPDDSDVKFELATTYRIVGRTVEKLGRLQEARSYYESDLQITEELVVEQPTHAVWVSYLAIGHGYLAALLRSMGRLDEAMPHYAANQRIREELMDMDPSNQIWQRESAVAYLALGRAELEAGNLGRARALFLQSVSILEGLTALDATNRDWREQLASSRVALGELLYKEERFGDARAAASQALALAEDLALEETTELVQRFCAESHLLMGKAEHAVGLYEEAEASWTQGVEVIEPAVRATSDTRLMAVLAKLQLYLDDARAESLMRALLERGYRRKDLVELCVQRGVCDAGTSSVRGTDSPR